MDSRSGGVQVCHRVVGNFLSNSYMATLQWRAALLRQRTRLFSDTLLPTIPRRFHATQASIDPGSDASSHTPNQRRRWTKPEIKEIYDSPLLGLIFRAAQAHRLSHDPSKVQLCTLMNIKSAHMPLDPPLPILTILALHDSRWLL